MAHCDAGWERPSHHPHKLDEILEFDAFSFISTSAALLSFDYLGDFDNVSVSYNREGNAAPWFQYASGTDLSKFVVAQLQASQITSMREAHGSVGGVDIWGLGTILYAPTHNDDFVFGHDGANGPAINSTVRIYPETGDAIIVLLTGHPSLASAIGFHWVLWQTGYPDFLNIDLVIESMILPLLLVIFIAVLTGFKIRQRILATRMIEKL